MVMRRSTRTLAWGLCFAAAVSQTACQYVGSLSESPPEIDVVEVSPRVESAAEPVSEARPPSSDGVNWQKIGETTAQVVYVVTIVALNVLVTSLDVYYSRNPGNWKKTR